MAFPLTIEHTITFSRLVHPSLTAAQAFDSIVNEFERERNVHYNVEDRTIEYRLKNFFSATRSKDMGLATSGRITVQDNDGNVVVKYILNMKNLIFVSIFGVAFLTVPIIFAQHQIERHLQFGLPILFFVWLFGGNYVFAKYRFKRYLECIIIPAVVAT